MRICICDDDKYVHDEIKALLQLFSTSVTQFDITDTNSGEEILNYYNMSEPFDLIFLDIEMDQMNGIQTAEKIRKTDQNAIIIFVSSHSNYVFDTFRLEALHFLVKPIIKSEFEDVFKRAINKYKKNNSYITLKWLSERYTVLISNITYVEGYKRHITVHTINEEFEAIGKIPDMLRLLEPHGFIRVHQGYIVNMEFIKRFDINDVILQDNTKVMISVRRRSEALKAYDIYLQKWKC